MDGGLSAQVAASRQWRTPTHLEELANWTSVERGVVVMGPPLCYTIDVVCLSLFLKLLNIVCFGHS